MELWTAQFNYSGLDRLDVTYKSNEQLFLAIDEEVQMQFKAEWVRPTKEMVHGYKYGWQDLDENGKQLRYVHMYNEIMKKAWEEHLMEMYKVAQEWPEVTLVCYCPSGAFCHRLLLVQYLEQLGATYMGER